MKEKDFDKTSLNNHKAKHIFFSHLKLMVLCCGLPLFGFLIFAGFGITTQSLEMVLLLICPLGMIAVFISMKNKRNEREEICCDEIDQIMEDSIGLDYSPNKNEDTRPNRMDLERLNRRKNIQKPLLYPRFTKRRRAIVTDFQTFSQN